MPKLGEMFPSAWLKASDFDEDSDTILTISELKSESIGQGADAGPKWVMYFEELDKGLILNKVNTTTIAKLYGDDTDDWEGKRIALYTTEVEYQGKVTLGVRVRLKAPKEKKAKSTVPPAPKASEDDDEGDADIPF